MAKRRYDYDVILSFARRDRKIAERMAKALTGLEIRVLSEEIDQLSSAGEDLFQTLRAAYLEKAPLCVVLFSKNYHGKKWAQTEPGRTPLQNILDRLFWIRLDDTALPALAASADSIALDHDTIADAVGLILDMLGKEQPAGFVIERLLWDGKFVRYNRTRMVSYWPQQIRKAQTITSLRWLRPSSQVKYLARVKYGDEEEDWGADRGPCHDCRVIKGQYHVPTCEVERCPVCGGQIMSCDCPGDLEFESPSSRK